MSINTILKWNLDDILPVKSFSKLYSEIEVELKKIDGWILKLDPSMKENDFKKLVKFRENLTSQMSRLSYLPHLMEAVDQKNSVAKLYKSRLDNLFLEYSQKIRPISHWLKGKKIKGKKKLDDKNAKRLFGAIKDLEYSLNYNRLAAKYTLSQKEEIIIAQKDISGNSVLTDLRSLIETEFEYELKVKNSAKQNLVKKIKTQSELLALVHSPKAELREAAYRSLLEKQKDNLDKFFAIYQAIVKDWDYEAKLRGFTSPIQTRNFANQISDLAIENLLTVCRENRVIFQNFFKYKAKMLGLNKLKRFDIYAPVESKEKLIKFPEALETVKKVFNDFSPRFGALAQMIIDQKHIDSHPQANKRSGAFCATVNPKITPYVMMNFTGRIRDVSTLAHELGHAVHSLLASQHLPSVQHANLPLAETASTLAEMILFENLYQKETDPKIKKSMLMEKLADSYASILRQNYFVIFEIRAHELISKGCTAKQLSELWLETLKEQFGDSVEIDQIFKYEWSYIPHIVNTPFYCYAYNFGELLSYALFARYKNERQEFVSNIETILMAGGSQDPTKILKEVGIDINSKQIWNDSFLIIKEWQLRLEQL